MMSDPAVKSRVRRLRGLSGVFRTMLHAACDGAGTDGTKDVIGTLGCPTDIPRSYGGTVPRPSSRLDLAVVPSRERAVTQCRLLLAHWTASGVCDERGAPGLRAESVVHGGFARIRLDLPLGPVLYANQQGGFRVACPSCQTSVVPNFASALRRVRQGHDTPLSCGHCGIATRVDDLVYSPPAAVGEAALVIADAGHGTLTDEALADIRAHIEAAKVIAIRVSTR